MEIEKELRSQLEDAINDGISKGLTREDAEKEAILQFVQILQIPRLIIFYNPS